MMRQTRVGLFTIDEDDGRSVWRRGLGVVPLLALRLCSSSVVGAKKKCNRRDSNPRHLRDTNLNRTP